jgi:hypothetical protein
MSWSDGHSYGDKFARLSYAIDAASDKRVVLIGESAGGSMVLNMYATRSDAIYKVMSICGKNTHPENVAPSRYRRNPAFKTSMDQVGESVRRLTKKQRQAFISIYPLADHVVPIEETFIPDGQRQRLWSVGHLLTIFLALSCLAWYIVRIAKR